MGLAIRCRVAILVLTWASTAFAQAESDQVQDAMVKKPYAVAAVCAHMADVKLWPEVEEFQNGEFDPSTRLPSVNSSVRQISLDTLRSGRDSLRRPAKCAELSRKQSRNRSIPTLASKWLRILKGPQVALT